MKRFAFLLIATFFIFPGCSTTVKEFNPKPILEELGSTEVRAEIPAPPRVVTTTTAEGVTKVDTIPGTRGGAGRCGEKAYFRIYVGEAVDAVHIEFKQQIDGMSWENVAESLTHRIKDEKRTIISYIVPKWPVQHEMTVEAYVAEGEDFRKVDQTRARFKVMLTAKCGR